MTPTEKRNRLRAILKGNVCKSPATVWDALSARVAEAAGFECGILSGSVCAATVLGAPDLACAIDELEVLQEPAARAGSFAGLLFAADTQTPRHGALLQHVQWVPLIGDFTHDVLLRIEESQMR